MDQQEPKETHSGNQDAIVGSLFFPVSPLKLIVLSVCTFGFYEFYWFYRNWCLIKEREDSLSMRIGFRSLNMWPFWRALFSVLFCYSCFGNVLGFLQKKRRELSS